MEAIIGIVAWWFLAFIAGICFREARVPFVVIAFVVILSDLGVLGYWMLQENEKVWVLCLALTLLSLPLAWFGLGRWARSGVQSTFSESTRLLPKQGGGSCTTP